MQNILKIILFIFIYQTLLAQQQKMFDLFPLEIGTRYIYSYNSLWDENNHFWHDYTQKEEGIVQYQVMDKTEIDSLIYWSIYEQDSIVITIKPGYGHDRKDTSYLKKTNRTFNLIEKISGYHEISASSYFPIWSFPFYTPALNSHVPSPVKINRYSMDSILKEYRFYWLSPGVEGYDYTLLFNNKTGLSSVETFYHRGNNYVYEYGTTSKLIERVVSIKYFPNGVCKYHLSQNYPNPFNPSTTIRFEIPKSTFVIIKIYNTLGQEVSTITNERLSPGVYEKIWKASGLPGGVYFYRLQAGEYPEKKRYDTSEIIHVI
jgi:hypothetical protein